MQGRDSGLFTKVGSAALFLAFLAFLLASQFGQAQVSGDLRNVTLKLDASVDGDISLSTQVDATGTPLMAGGVTVKKGGDVTFDRLGRLESQTPGFWKAQEGRHYKVLFWSTKDERFAIIEVQGVVRWDEKRNVVSGAENFLRIATLDNKKEVEITGRKMVNGRLVITTAVGRRFAVFGLSPDPSGVIAIEK